MLVANDPTLRNINVAYRGLADERRDVLRHRVFTETQGTHAGVIVDAASADPGLPGDPPVPIDADHVGIDKPFDRSSVLYSRVRDFVSQSPIPARHAGSMASCPLPPIRSERSPDILPKLLRVAAVCVVGLVAFKGEQALIAPAPDPQPFIAQMAEKDRQISRLLALLEDRRTTPAPPGAAQELRRAVTAIEEGAAGDTRYARALDLLKAGNLVEAEFLLKAVAEDRAGRAEQEGKAAAAAYRNLASIAAVTEPGRAREYYAQAVRLDPVDVEGMFWHGWYQQAAGQLDAAHAAYGRVIAMAKAGDEGWTFWAWLGHGDIQQLRGDLGAVLATYREAGARMGRLAAADRRNAGWQSDLSVSYNKAGDVQQAQDDLASALRSYNDGLAIREGLATADRGNAVWQRDLSVSYAKIGDARRAQGDLASGLKSYNDGLAIAERLAASDRGNAGWQRDLLLSYARLATLAQMSGDNTKALDALQRGQAISLRLARLSPDNAGWQRDLAWFNEQIGRLGR